MGRGNVCVHGPCEGLYYIDADDFQVYVADGEAKLLGELDYATLTDGSWIYDAALSDHGPPKESGEKQPSAAEAFITRA